MKSLVLFFVFSFSIFHSDAEARRKDIVGWYCSESQCVQYTFSPPTEPLPGQSGPCPANACSRNLVVDPNVIIDGELVYDRLYTPMGILRYKIKNR